MISTNDLRMFAKYQTIRAVRQSDGATLIATRIINDEKRPVSWDAEENDPSWFKPPVLKAEGPYSTSQLIKKAQADGYGDWYPVPPDAEPDSKDYLVD